jgi:hypothetical protein
MYVFSEAVLRFTCVGISVLWAVGLRSGNLLENPFESLPSGTTVMWFVV